MKRGLLITVGIVLILALIAVWVYILFFSESGGSQDQDTFADLNISGGQDVEAPPPQNDDEILVEVSSNERLRQLTTEQSIGFTEVKVSSTSNPSLYYAVPGTGHITSVNLINGEERRVSATTIPAATNAVITSNGKHALFQYGFGSQTQTVVGQINSGASELVEQRELGDNLISVTSLGDTFVYGEIENSSVVAKQYNPETKETIELFEIPFVELNIEWGSTLSDTHYVYPKANSNLEGYLYQVKGGVMTRVPVDGYGLTVVGNNEVVAYSHVTQGTYKSEVYNHETDSSRFNLIDLLPEKCLYVDNESYFLCAKDSNTNFKASTPDGWYQGTVSYSDDFWLFNSSFSTGNFSFDLEQQSGRQIDVHNLSTSHKGDVVYFQNKNDGTIWSFQVFLELPIDAYEQNIPEQS